MIYTVNDFFNDEGGERRHVKEFVIIDGDPPKDFPKYIGVSVIGAQLGSQIVPRQYSANLHADTLQEAFKNFDEIMEKAGHAALEDFEKEMQERFDQQRKEEASKIVVPN